MARVVVVPLIVVGVGVVERERETERETRERGKRKKDGGYVRGVAGRGTQRQTELSGTYHGRVGGQAA